jgi:hypothetical protein
MCHLHLYYARMLSYDYIDHCRGYVYAQRNREKLAILTPSIDHFCRKIMFWSNIRKFLERCNTHCRDASRSSSLYVLSISQNYALRCTRRIAEAGMFIGVIRVRLEPDTFGRDCGLSPGTCKVFLPNGLS